MQAPNVKDNTVADVEDNHLHCRSCGFKIPVTTDSRFCSICANKSENILKFFYYLEMLAFAVILGYVILGYLYTAIEFIEWVISNNKSVSDPDDQYRFDEDLFIVIPSNIIGIIVVWFWYFKRLKYVDAQSYPYPKRVVESVDNLELEKINQEILDLNRRKQELEGKI